MKKNRLSRITISIVLAAVGVAACGGGGDDAISRRDCERLRDHVVELRLATVTADREQHEAALKGSLGEPFVEQCLTTATTAGLRCQLAATATEALAACGDE